LIRQKKNKYFQRFIRKKLYLKRPILKKKMKKWWWFLKKKRGRPAGWLKKINFWINLKFYGVQYSLFKRNKTIHSNFLFTSKFYNKFFFEEHLNYVSNYCLQELFTTPLDDELYNLKLSEYLIEHNYYFLFMSNFLHLNNKDENYKFFEFNQNFIYFNTLNHQIDLNYQINLKKQCNILSNFHTFTTIN